MHIMSYLKQLFYINTLVLIHTNRPKYIRIFKSCVYRYVIENVEICSKYVAGGSFRLVREDLDWEAQEKL